MPNPKLAIRNRKPLSSVFFFINSRQKRAHKIDELIDHIFLNNDFHLINWHSYLLGTLKPIPKTRLSAHGCITGQLNTLHKSKSLLYCFVIDQNWFSFEDNIIQEVNAKMTLRCQIVI